MKIVLIILGIIVALALIGLVWPLLIFGGIAWSCFSAGSIGWGILWSCIGIFAEFCYILGVLTESGGENYSDTTRRSGISWLRAFTALYIIDHMHNKGE